MKTKLFLSVLLTQLLIVTLLLSNSVAQDHTKWHLPEGAKARLCKGNAYNIAYSLNGKYLAVSGNIGIWLYDAQTYEESSLLANTSGDFIAFSPDGQTLASAWDDTVRLTDMKLK